MNSYSNGRTSTASMGPVAYLEFEDSMPKWEFAAGALFGVWDATSDVTFKFDAEVEF